MGCGQSLSVLPLSVDQPSPLVPPTVPGATSPKSQIRCDLDIILFYRSVRNLFVQYLEELQLETLLFLYEDLLRQTVTDGEATAETWAYIDCTYFSSTSDAARQLPNRYEQLFRHDDPRKTLPDLLCTLANDLAEQVPGFTSSSYFIDFLRSDSMTSFPMRFLPKVVDEEVVRVLLFDKSRFHGQLLSTLLRFACYDVTLACTKQDAFTALGERSYALVIVANATYGVPKEDFLTDYNSYLTGRGNDQSKLRRPLFISLALRDDVTENLESEKDDFDYSFHIPVSIHEILKLAPVSVSYDGIGISESGTDTPSSENLPIPMT